ncbi:MAG TPA: hypothetical protein VIX91_20255 [Candidatus Acidoferrum sp.]
MSTNAVAARNPRANSTTLGARWIVYAIFRLVAVVLLVLYAGAATVMFGAHDHRSAICATDFQK